jgi:hypothetical protein
LTVMAADQEFQAHAARPPGAAVPSSQGSRPYSRSVQPHRFGYLLEITGIGRS